MVDFGLPAEAARSQRRTTTRRSARAADAQFTDTAHPAMPGGAAPRDTERRRASELIAPPVRAVSPGQKTPASQPVPSWVPEVTQPADTTELVDALGLPSGVTYEPQSPPQPRSPHSSPGSRTAPKASLNIPPVAPMPTFDDTLTASGLRTARWRRSYARRLRITDSLIVFATVFGAQLARFGGLSDPMLPSGMLDISYPLISAIISVAWLTALSVYSSRDSKVIGNGVTEYRRVADATLRMFGMLAIVAFSFQLPIARGYLLIALPVGLVALIASRWAWRSWLQRQRAQGRYVQRAVLVGERAKSTHVAQQIAADPTTGIKVMGAVTEHGSRNELMPGIPVLAGYDDVLAGLDAVGADTVVFSGSDIITPQQLRELGWNLESRRIDLIVAPALTDIAGPRIHSRPVAGLPLIYIDFPAFEGRRYWTKRLIDILASGLGLLLLSPMFLVLALIIRRDGGPAFFSQERVGLNGNTFRMYKFRSMVVDAEARLDDLRDQSEGNGVLFKMKSDPRVTWIGRTLRRYSIDELPQLVNVLRGEMSLVGPRPPLKSEVEEYDEWVRRRFLVKPGITGLWQVSGRSDLSWDDSVRLDLYYVENWSVTSDFVILWRTVRAVLSPNGAY